MEGEWRIPALRRAFEALGARRPVIQYDGRGTGRVAARRHGPVARRVRAATSTRSSRRPESTASCCSASTTPSTHAIAWAARHPERVRGLVLFGGALRGWDPMRGSGTQALLSLIERDWDTFVESVAHAWLGWPTGEEGRLAADWFRTATTPAIARATLQAAGDIDVTADAAARDRCPALVLHRADASVIPFELSAELARALPAGRLEVLPGLDREPVLRGRRRVVGSARRVRRGTRWRDRRGRPRTALGRRRARGSGALSPREIEVLRLLADGETNGQIAARLGISINTVERHVGNVYRKIDARGRADATAWAIRNGVA